jgi:hypothetical protein
MTNHVLVNVAAALLSAYAVAFGSAAWLARPVLASPPPYAMVADVPPGIEPSDAAFWSGVSALAIVVVNGVVAAWGKRQDSQLDRVENRFLKQAAADRAANDERARVTLEAKAAADREIADLKAALALASASGDKP